MIFLLIPFVLVIGLSTVTFLDPDFGWHIYLGRVMTQSHSLVHTLVGYNVFSANHLIDHEWLSDLGMNFLYVHFGYISLILVTLGTLWCILWLLFKTMNWYALEWPYIILGMAVFGSMLSVSYGVRVQILLLLGVALLTTIARFEPHRQRRRVWYFLLFLLGGNMHGGFMLAAIIPLVMEWPEKGSGLRGGKELRDYLVTLAVIFLALSINPYGLDMWRLTLAYLGDGYYLANINEWKSIFQFPLRWFQIMVPLFLIGFLFLATKVWRQIPHKELLLLLFFGCLGVLHVRFWALFAWFVIPWLVVGLHSIWKPTIPLKVISIFTVVIWSLVMMKSDMVLLPKNPLDPRGYSGYPQAALAYVGNRPKCQTGLFNSYDWGGYILGFYPGHEVFIDGRGPQLKLSSGSTLLQEYNRIMLAPESTLDQYPTIQCLLVRNPKRLPTTALDKFLFRLQGGRIEDAVDQIFEKDTTLTEYLQSSSKWHRIYTDEIASVYEKGE